MKARLASPVVAGLAAALLMGGGALPADAAGSRLLRGGAVDGDTVWVTGRTQTVRVIGIDTPERGQCGYDRAKRATSRFVSDGFRLRKSATTDNKDRYQRKLRYVKDPRGRDLGVYLIRRGLAVARYDSRDGYEWHRKQKRYHRLDRKQRNVCGFNPTSGTGSTGGSSGGNRDSRGRG